MRNLAKIIQLSKEQQEFFSNFSEEHTYNTPAQIIYRGQIPHAAYILTEGKVLIRDGQKKIIHECTPGTIIGYYELFHNAEFTYTAEISAGSKVMILGRFTVLDIQKKHPEDIRHLLEIQ
ncbi:MAG: cyclic nucleotide-binding domain-containing protein [Halobacteriovoraceae bacterium]|jgi:CRP-like cAMP-binding protein|nr:cyclic nucleotide-binding domain-containing protein [Halobacteriovoraceae bacterium]